MKKILFALLVLSFVNQAVFCQSSEQKKEESDKKNYATLGQDGQNTPTTGGTPSDELLPTLGIMPFQWVDLTDLSKKAKAFEGEVSFVGFSSLDENYDAINLDMSFEYFGEKYTSAAIIINGFVALGGSGLGSGSAITQQNVGSYFGPSSYSPSGLPSPRTPNNVIAPLWVDINFENSQGFIFYRTFKPEVSDRTFDHIVIQWEDAGLFQDFSYGDQSVRVTFEVVLFAKGGIMFQYKLISAIALRQALVQDQQHGFLDPTIDLEALTDFELIKKISNVSIGYEDKTGLKGASWGGSVSSTMSLGNELIPDWASGSGNDNFLDIIDGRDRRNNAVTGGSGSGGCFLAHKKSSQDR